MSLKKFALPLMIASGFAACTKPNANPETREDAYSYVVQKSGKGVADLLVSPPSTGRKLQDSTMAFTANTLELVDSCKVGIHEVSNEVSYMGFAHKNTIYNLHEATAKIDYVDADGTKTDPQYLNYNEFEEQQKNEFALAEKIAQQSVITKDAILKKHPSDMFSSPDFYKAKKIQFPFK